MLQEEGNTLMLKGATEGLVADIYCHLQMPIVQNMVYAPCHKVIIRQNFVTKCRLCRQHFLTLSRQETNSEIPLQIPKYLLPYHWTTEQQFIINTFFFFFLVK